MKVRISYFYQIRNFKKYMLPMSVCMSDPAWYHEFKGPDHIYKDSRGILNGLRLNPIIVQGNTSHSCPCIDKNPDQCPIASEYENELNKIDFDKMYKAMNDFCTMYQQQEKINEEPIAVLIVYEAPNNLCSERYPLIEYFNKHGVECKELDYPIK